MMTLSYLLSTGAMTLFQGAAGTGNTMTVLGLELICLGICLAYCILIIDVLKVDIFTKTFSSASDTINCFIILQTLFF